MLKRGCLAGENKAPGKPLNAALRQLMTYATALENAPLLMRFAARLERAQPDRGRRYGFTRDIEIRDCSPPTH